MIEIPVGEIEEEDPFGEIGEELAYALYLEQSAYGHLPHPATIPQKELIDKYTVLFVIKTMANDSETLDFAESLDKNALFSCCADNLGEFSYVFEEKMLEKALSGDEITQKEVALIAKEAGLSWIYPTMTWNSLPVSREYSVKLLKNFRDFIQFNKKK